jgi:hypothetical protein
MWWNSVVKLWEYQCRSVFRCNATIILLVDFMVLKVHGVVTVTLVKSPFLKLGLIDG